MSHTVTCIIIVQAIITLIESRHLQCSLDCPDGHKCAIRRSVCPYPPCKQYPVCVPDEDTPSDSIPSNSRTHPGVCTLPATTGPCLQQCQSDGDCQQDEKCCFNGCGQTCTSTHSVEVTKPGTCPRRLRTESMCGMDCNSDSDCPGVEKCCLTACGSTCSRPCYYWLWTMPNRATGARSAFWALSPQCRHL